MDQKILESVQKDFLAIIPARSGSKGIKNKNIKCLNGYPLIAYAIAAAQMTPSITRIIVSTDSEVYANVAKQYGAEVPFLRPKELSEDASLDIEFIKHAIQWLFDNEGKVSEYLVHLRCTYPIRDVKTIEHAVEAIKNDKTATSLRSAHLAVHTPYKWFRQDENGYFAPLFYGMTADDANMPRQNFPAVYIPDGNVDILKSSFIIKTGLMHGNKLIGYVSPEGIDIDNMKDLNYLKNYLNYHTCDVLEYLRENYEPLNKIKF